MVPKIWSQMTSYLPPKSVGTDLSDLHWVIVCRHTFVALERAVFFYHPSPRFSIDILFLGKCNTYDVRNDYFDPLNLSQCLSSSSFETHVFMYVMFSELILIILQPVNAYSIHTAVFHQL